MKKNDEKKKVSGVSSTKGAAEVKRTESVSEVSAVKAATGVGGVKGTGGVSGKRNATRIMSQEERDQLLRLIDDEAQKMFGAGGIPAEKKELITQAVKMAVDSGILLDTDVPEESEKK